MTYYIKQHDKYLNRKDKSYFFGESISAIELSRKRANQLCRELKSGYNNLEIVKSFFP